jgi:hypothetical protein
MYMNVALFHWNLLQTWMEVPGKVSLLRNNNLQYDKPCVAWQMSPRVSSDTCQIDGSYFHMSQQDAFASLDEPSRLRSSGDLTVGLLRKTFMISKFAFLHAN